MNDASTQAIERYLAFGKGIKSVNSLIRRDAGRKMYDDLGIFSGIVIYTSYLYLTFSPAAVIDCIRLSVVVPYGISVMTRVFLSI